MSLLCYDSSDVTVLTANQLILPWLDDFGWQEVGPQVDKIFLSAN